MSDTNNRTDAPMTGSNHPDNTLHDIAAERWEDLPAPLRRGYPTHLTLHDPHQADARWLLCPRQKMILENLSATGTGLKVLF